jgi:hypothetical protein
MGTPPLGKNGARPGRFYRGSRRRLRRIRFRGNWSLEIVFFVIWLLFALFVLVPWIVRHPHL